MPKPYTGSWGSGHHMNLSLASAATGENLFREHGESRDWTPTTYSFVAGIVNRLAGHNNRSCMIRLPFNRPALENRAVDSAANTYLATALIVAAGMEGIEQGLHAGDPVRDQTYDWTATRPGAVRLPRTLLEAIEAIEAIEAVDAFDAFEQDPLVHEVFAPHLVREHADMKRGECHSQVTDWEREYYLLNL